MWYFWYLLVLNLLTKYLMNIKLIYLSRNKNNNIELLVNDYEKKINHFVKFSSFCLKNKSQSNEKSQIIKCESDLILKT